MFTGKPALRNGLLGLGLLAIVALTVVLAVLVANRQSRSDALTDKTCAAKPHKNYQAVIQADKIKPTHIDARQCDRLTIVNRDDDTRLLAFGLHEKHRPYDGVSERLLSQGQSLTVTLIQTGNFRLHDHIHDEVQATFTVKPR